MMNMPLCTALRQHYRPMPERVPAWLQRVWRWF